MFKKKLYFIFLVLVSFAACNKTHIEVRNLPINTPIGAQLYLTGNFNNWNPGDANYLMKYDVEKNIYYGDLPAGFGKINYKITRGDWSTVEVDSCGGDILNRSFDLGSKDTLLNYINGFKDLAPVYCGRLTIVLDEIPMNTPLGSKIFLSGNVNYWMLKQRPYEFTKLKDGKYYLTVPRRENQLIFKINRGSWESIEMAENTIETESRVVEFGHEDTIHIKMRPWVDLPLEQLITKTLIIQQYPKETDAKSAIYLSGTFNNWQPFDEKYRFKPNKTGAYELKFAFGETEIEYFKITRGNWEKREVKSTGGEINNRILAKKGKDTVLINVLNWADKISKTTLLKNKNLDLKQGFENKLDVQPTRIENPYIIQKEFFRKIIFIIDKCPAMQSPNSKIYLTGDFNDWVTDAQGYAFKELPNGKKYFILRLNDKLEHEFKITRGDWSNEEADQMRNPLNNRKIPYGYKDDTIHLEINNWKDYIPFKKLVVAINKLPSNTPPFSNFYLSGNFNGWVANVETYKFKQQGDKYYLSIPQYNENYWEYKITRGSWETEFASKRGKILPNQKFKKKYLNDTMYIEILGWKDIPSFN